MFNLSSMLIADQFDKAESFEQWQTIAEAEDQRTGNFAWRKADKSNLYHYESIRHRLTKLKSLRLSENGRDLLFTLNEGIHGNMDGIGNPSLYRRALSGTKEMIDQYVDEVIQSLHYIAKTRIPGVTRAQKEDFFDRAAHCYGLTALMLSGAGALGYFHLGVAVALNEQRLLPRVISGSSAGSLIAGIIGTRSARELDSYLKTDRLREQLREQDLLVEPGLLRRMTDDQIIAQIHGSVPDLTFQEAYEISRRHINITVSATRRHQKSRLLNAITSPNVLVRSAIQASCAIPGVFSPVTLLARDAHGKIKKYLPKETWVDGSLASDLPARRLSRLYGVNHYIASQANPLVLWSLLEFRHRDGLIPNILDFGLRIQKEWLRYLRSSTAKVLKRAPTAAYVMDSMFSIAGQEYAGDINLVPHFRLFDPRKILSHLSEEDRDYLIDAGQRATWPQVAKIRNSSSIALALYEIQSRYRRKQLAVASSNKQKNAA